MKDKFCLKTWSIGYEIPFLDLQDSTGQVELSNGIAERYLNWFDCLKVDLMVIGLPSGNQMMLFTIVVRVDLDLANLETLEEDWTKMQLDLQSVIEEFLKIRNITEYRIIKQ